MIREAKERREKKSSREGDQCCETVHEVSVTSTQSFNQTMLGHGEGDMRYLNY
jgi:hypothetical protein